MALCSQVSYSFINCTTRLLTLAISGQIGVFETVAEF